MSTFETYILGQTDTEIISTEIDEQIQIIEKMLQQADYSVDIISHYFDPAIYDTPHCVDAMEEFMLRNKRYARIRVLLHDPKTVLQRGHRLLEYGLRFSSFFQFRRVAKIHRTEQKALFLVDKTGFLQRLYTDSLKTQACFHAPQVAGQLSKWFEHLWGQAEHDPNLRNLTL